LDLSGLRKNNGLEFLVHRFDPVCSKSMAERLSKNTGASENPNMSDAVATMHCSITDEHKSLQYQSRTNGYHPRIESIKESLA
jgi:hypothetical protein